MYTNMSGPVVSAAYAPHALGAMRRLAAGYEVALLEVSPGLAKFATNSAVKRECPGQAVAMEGKIG